MDSADSTKNKQIENASVEGLIKREWEIINQLERMVNDPELTVAEKIHAANVFAFHAITLNKLLARSGEKGRFEEQNLGDYIIGVEPRIARCFRRDFRVWKKTLSSRRY